MRHDIAPGRSFPDYELPDHTKTPRRLSALQGDDPMLLVLIRGFFCPKDREQLKELTRFHPQLVVGYCRLVVITTDDWHTTNNLRQQLGAHYPFLYDERRQVRDELEILEYTDPDDEPMIPHTLLLEPQLRIRRIWNSYAEPSGSKELPDWIKHHRDRYLATNGEEGYLWDASLGGGKGLVPTLLLTTTGRKSGRSSPCP
jgi:peroxiredoxin